MYGSTDDLAEDLSFRPSPGGMFFHGEVPWDYSEMAHQDMNRGISVAVDPHGNRHTCLSNGSWAASRIGPCIVEALHAALWNGEKTVPLGKLFRTAQLDFPSLSEGEFLAAISHMLGRGDLGAINHESPDDLVKGDLRHDPLCGGKNIHTATLWVKGSAIHHIGLPRRPEAKGQQAKGSKLAVERKR